MSSRAAEAESWAFGNFEAVFQNSPQATAITRLADGVHLHDNDSFLRLLGYSREELVGQSAVTLGMWTTEQRAQFVESLLATGGASVVAPLRKRDGTPLRVALSSAKIDFCGEACLVTVAVDLAEREAREAALKEADRRKDVAIAALAHEMRGPLMPILLTAEYLKRTSDLQSLDDLDVIVRQTKHLSRLVEDLVDASGVMRGKVEIVKRRMELRDIVARAVEASGPLLEARRQRLEVSLPEEGLAIDGDEVRLTQVVNNLLSNAARYTQPGGNVAVIAMREDDDVVLSVRDSGIGIDAALMPNIFKMFVQGTRVPTGDNASSGLGLGLALVQSLVEMHGGTVTARSDGDGCGSEFLVRLPASRVETGAKTAS